MAVKPILFSAEMVKAILDRRKTQKRMVVKPQPTTRRWNNTEWLMWDKGHGHKKKQPYASGDVLWVKESYWDHYVEGSYEYYADYYPNKLVYSPDRSIAMSAKRLRWMPGVLMPERLARTFLRVKDVRLERLQDISEEAAIAEGFAKSPDDADPPRRRFAEYWDTVSIKAKDRAKYGWDANPWVWVINFERCEKPDDWKY